jgi:nucleoside-diphosphate-sugar epimerase
MAKKRCGWEPAVSLRDGLAEVVEYIGDNLGLFEVDRYTT